MAMHERKQRATFSIDSAVKEELEARIPSSKRSGFVERAIAEALRKEAIESLRKTLDSMEGYSSDGEDSVEMLRRLRSERDTYLAARHGSRH
ncbi:hypothetical protein L598_000200001500 [Mesorhizobium sp. J18]|uniref:hypothetical protein n=1 Tax=Mesorhizobium sp. J18 TaxID=935263 RepID=UPI00119AEF6E|nr:hypothetical protein [Mesorhizobium sp. J18]TWG98011.1 hypothetical protein L598_000200001500 [Mesorhizobium sp. J18]